ncbi:NAD(+) kinase [Marinobacterium sp. AK62]|uniref:NAD kinase n=1 Tax=Marinobacterium alkalitolerans TaxID=1542925 RepID=A0ABS3ZER0_9GAMM|nr:NAD(+) kinase [Marinobacterium alkalitolerans]MBP0049529.1 NAD(+) kinase [Marinobacterium alkalitolerans]
MDNFRNIGLIGRLGSKSVIDTLKELIRFLDDRGLNVILDQTIADVMPGHGQQVCKQKMMGEICDLAIVVGGDGSLLGAARSLAQSKIPVLGINRGNLGFLTDIPPQDFEDKLVQVLSGHYMVDTRFLLDVEIKRNGEPIGEMTALNDCVVHPGKATRMIQFELYIEGQFVYTQKSDGLIVSTPTGSTAYALSGGGPIMHPKLDALVLVPMFPHTLSSRPIVVDGNSELKLVITEDNKAYPSISCDGQLNQSLAPGDSITIRKKSHKLKLLHPRDYDFYRTCREKLGWGTKFGEQE